MSNGSPRILTPEEKRWDYLVAHDETIKSPIDKLVLSCLFRYHIHYPQVFVGEEKIAVYALCSSRAVRKSLKRLEADGWFTRRLLGCVKQTQIWRGKMSAENVVHLFKDADQANIETSYGDGGGPTEIVVRVVHEYQEPVEQEAPSKVAPFLWGCLIGFLLGG